jgi:hypothetical protein
MIVAWPSQADGLGCYRAVPSGLKSAMRYDVGRNGETATGVPWNAVSNI